jgi:outer membrane protein OmpA-like peptidoglycan-associated protein
MKAVGFGDEKPLVENTTPENKKKNRRTEFTILTK